MGSVFHALKLKSGEGFLLNMDHGGEPCSILVDGGTNGRDLLAAIGGRARVKGGKPHLDIVICTHSDTDHSKGLPDFVNLWCGKGNTIGEFWLPSGWAHATPLIMTDPDKFSQMVMEGYQSIVEKLSDVPRMLVSGFVPKGRRAYAPRSRLYSKLRWAWREIQSREQVVSLMNVTDATREPRRTVRDALGLPESFTPTGTPDFNISVPDKLFTMTATGPKRRDPVLSKVKETSKRIWAINDAAIQHDIMVRWFSFDLFEADPGRMPRGRDNDPLIPMSACETFDRPAPSPEALFLSLRLSEQNVESLTFLKPETATEPALILLGDSRLAFGEDKPEKEFPMTGLPVPKRPPLITAAHHGSNYNDMAYQVLEKWLGAISLDDCLVIRAGGLHNQKIGRFFKLKRKACARCVQLCYPGSNPEKRDDWRQEIRAEVVAGQWVLASQPAVRPCGTPTRGNWQA